MKPAPFRYLAPGTVEEALAALAEHGDDARPLAGGQSLVPLMNMRIARPTVLVDLNAVAGLDGVEVDGDALVLGAMVRQSAAEADPLVAGNCPLLKQTLRFVGPPATKNRGTVGGSLAHADPLAELPGTALALGAEFVVESVRGRRALASETFYIAELTTALEPDELLREIRWPRAAAGACSAFVESGNRAEGPPVAGVACTLRRDEAGSCRAVALVAIGVGPGPVRLGSAERALTGEKPAAAAIAAAAAAAGDDIDPRADVHASARYRARLTVALVERAIQRALAA